MIKIITKQNHEDYLLKATFENEVLKNWLIKKEGALTFISDQKLIYLYLGKKEKLDYFKLHKHLKKAIDKIAYDLSLQIDAQSFLTQKLDLKTIVQLWTETIVEQTHKLYKLTSKSPKILKQSSFQIIVPQQDVEIDKLVAKSLIKSQAVNFARDLQDMPPNLLTSEAFANLINDHFASNYQDIKISILKKQEIQKLNMNLLLAVNAASTIEPRVVVLEYKGDPKNNAKIALIGKGITFDTGGHSLKGWQHMAGMKFDMSGAAIVSATIGALSQLKPKINVVAISPLTDNRIGGKATLVESVVKSMNGKYVEIEDTDAEGRLVLADAITYGITKLNANKLITVATLTGAASRALGSWFTCGITTNQQFYDQFIKATDFSHERIWQMPVIDEHYQIMYDSKVADISNFPGELNAGMSTAAAFLFDFSEKRDMIHLDIAGTANYKKRGNGVIVKTLIEYLTK